MPSYADPFRVGRHPFQRYMLLAAIAGAFPLIVGESTSATIERALPPAVVVAWGAILTLGCVTALLGIYWPLRDPVTPRSYVTALTLERIGLGFVWPFALVYAAIVVIFAGLPGVLVGTLIAGFGWAAFIRMRDVGKVFKRAIADAA